MLVVCDWFEKKQAESFLHNLCYYSVQEWKMLPTEAFHTKNYAFKKLSKTQFFIQAAKSGTITTQDTT